MNISNSGYNTGYSHDPYFQAKKKVKLPSGTKQAGADLFKTHSSKTPTTDSPNGYTSQTQSAASWSNVREKITTAASNARPYIGHSNPINGFSPSA